VRPSDIVCFLKNIKRMEIREPANAQALLLDSDFPWRLRAVAVIVVAKSRKSRRGELFLTYWQTESYRIKYSRSCTYVIWLSPNSTGLTANCLDKCEAGGDGKSEGWIEGGGGGRHSQ
jgi:hypothetical protein